MDVVFYLNSRIKYDSDIFINKNVEVIFTKDITLTKMLSHIEEIFNKDKIEYKLLSKKSSSFRMKIKKDNNIYVIDFKKSQFI